jgi:hypothetical protein
MPLNKTPQPAGVNPPAEPLPPKKRVSAEDAYVGPVAQMRDKAGTDYMRNVALKKPGAIAGVGNYVYRPEADGSVTILHDPRGQANDVNLASGDEFDAIQTELAGAGAVDPAEAELHASLGESEIPAEAPPGQPGESPVDAPVGAVPDAPVAAEEPAPAEEAGGGIQDRFNRTFPSLSSTRESIATDYAQRTDPEARAPVADAMANRYGGSSVPVEPPVEEPNLGTSEPPPPELPPQPGETPVSPGEPGADLTSQQPAPPQLSEMLPPSEQAGLEAGLDQQTYETAAGGANLGDSAVEAEAEAAIALPDGAPQKESILEAALRKILGLPAEEQAPAA